MDGPSPRVRVVDPSIPQPDDRVPVPHMYGQRELCLFHPDKGEFSLRSALAHTLIPWCAEWLFYYEVWRATGEWHGGGEHPREA